ncbi:hypothetical protein PG993_008650 [Apiospora rasikravindrae]|uniref:Uncharacterized protein n=1 Tax=Apiospora rasikravindrae TaxID=990691 RepID=A0ABR1SR49_9PEZI
MAFEPGVIDELDLWLIKGTEHSNTPMVFSGIINFRFQWRRDWFKKASLNIRATDLQEVYSSTTTSAPAIGVIFADRNSWVKRFVLVFATLLDARVLGSHTVFQWLDGVLKNTPATWHDKSWPPSISRHVMDDVTFHLTQKKESLEERQRKIVIPNDQKTILVEIEIYLKHGERMDMGV